ncbi:hypothetical protein PCE1_001437 [Barthelona sp. PCE]
MSVVLTTNIFTCEIELGLNENSALAENFLKLVANDQFTNILLKYVPHSFFAFSPSKIERISEFLTPFTSESWSVDSIDNECVLFLFSSNPVTFGISLGLQTGILEENQAPIIGKVTFTSENGAKILDEHKCNENFDPIPALVLKQTTVTYNPFAMNHVKSTFEEQIVTKKSFTLLNQS